MMDRSPHPAGAPALATTGLELTPLSQPGALTAMHRFIFESWGYLIIPDVLSAAECDEALAAAQRVHGSRPAEKFRQVGRGFEIEPSLERLIDIRWCRAVHDFGLEVARNRNAPTVC